MALAKKNKMTADEFFDVTSECDRNRVELFEGEIINFASPTANHQRISGRIYAKILNYIDSNKGKCEPFMAPFDVKLDDYNVVQPDVLVICDPDKLKDGKRCNGAPDLVIEVTSSKWQRDYIDKLYVYNNSGVREYWIVDPHNKRVVVYKFFEDEKNPYIYTFEQNVPVGIFDDELELNIGEMI